MRPQLGRGFSTRKEAFEMMRNLKVLGLALVAMLAMSAVASSMASADTFTGESSPVALTGSQEGNDVFTITAGNTTCKEVIYTGTSASGVTTVTAIPQYPEKTASGAQNCTSLGLPALVHSNGCSYLFHIGAGTEGTLDIKCPEGKEVTVTAGYNVTTKCTIHVPAQTGLSKLTYSNVGTATGPTREVLVEAAITNLKYSHTKGTGLGACTAGSGTTGSYAGQARVTGEIDGSTEHVGIFLS